MSYVWDKIQDLHKRRVRSNRIFQNSDSKQFKKSQKVIDDWREETRIVALERLIVATNFKPRWGYQTTLDDFEGPFTP
jgi:hypothetical protein